MIEIVNRQIRIDGRAEIVVAGEVHYFRVPREEWEQRILLARDAGVNAIASYIPWLVHELPDGSIDVTGSTESWRDVGAFIDLCARHGLWFIARPGPFQMAELKNEGIPHRVYREHPGIVGTGWDAAPVPTASVDYLADDFLTETRRWYEAIMPVLAPRLQPRGGNVIAVQLDNEVGMLSWVANAPDFTPGMLTDLRAWIRAHREDADTCYRGLLDAPDERWAAGIQSPDEAWAPALRVDLAMFLRERLARYLQALRGMAEQLGIEGVPLVVNIHGTEGGSAEPFPIGISQLFEGYSGVHGMLSGSDHYVGEMTLQTTTDLYVINAFMAAMHDADQPITSMEFEAGTGDYGDGMEMLYDPHTLDLKTRLHLAQGCRLVNYYLLAGGLNQPLAASVQGRVPFDGTDLFSITGRRHGTAAPIGPEGQAGPSLAPSAAAMHALRANAPWLATSREQLGNLQLGFVVDSWAVEHCHPSSGAMRAVVDDLREHRGAGERRALAQSALFLGHGFDAVDLERVAPRRDADGRPVVLMLATSRHLSARVQQRLVDHLDAGGSLLLQGPLPELDLEGRPCRVLADAVGLSTGELARDAPRHFASVQPDGWLGPGPEFRTAWWQEVVCEGATPVLRSASGRVVGVDLPVGEGRLVLLSTQMPSSRPLFGRILDELGVRTPLRLDTDVPGVTAIVTVDAAGNRLLHLMNVTGYSPRVRLVPDERLLPDAAPLADAVWRPGPRRAAMLPLGIDTPVGRIGFANAEVAEVGADFVRFGPCVPLDGEDATVVHLTTGAGAKTIRRGGADGFILRP